MASQFEIQSWRTPTAKNTQRYKIAGDKAGNEAAGTAERLKISLVKEEIEQDSFLRQAFLWMGLYI